jgi:hypothetical protein
LSAPHAPFAVVLFHLFAMIFFNCVIQKQKIWKKRVTPGWLFFNFLAIDFSICVEKNLKKSENLLSITIDRL